MEEIIQFFLDLLQVKGGVWNHSSHRGINIDRPTQNQESSGRPQPKDIIFWDS
jgi:hypothetical protein